MPKIFRFARHHLSPCFDCRPHGLASDGSRIVWELAAANTKPQRPHHLVTPYQRLFFDPIERRVLTVALASSELAGVAETWRAQVA
jgi:hypothetical protein